MTPSLPPRYTEVNVVPLIDVLLVLIIIFMLQVLLIMKIQVPPPGDGDGSPPADDIVLQIDAGGGFAVNTTPVDHDSLAPYLTRVFRDRTRKVLLVQADRSRPYREVIRAMDTARDAGVQVLSILPNRR